MVVKTEAGELLEDTTGGEPKAFVVGEDRTTPVRASFLIFFAYLKYIMLMLIFRVLRRRSSR